MEHLSHLVGAYSRIIHLDCLFAYLFRILSPLCFRRICLFAMSADIPLRSAARESHLPLLCCCSAFRAFLLFLFHASIILLLHTFCQLPRKNPPPAAAAPFSSEIYLLPAVEKRTLFTRPFPVARFIPVYSFTLNSSICGQQIFSSSGPAGAT